MSQNQNEPRAQAYDETIKNLEHKDCQALASLAIPNIDEADEVVLSLYELSMADMKKPDYLAKIKLNGESFLLHMEFESSYRSNLEMQRRMIRYFANLYWNETLPIKQVLVILKKPKLKKISSGVELIILGDNVLNYSYQVIKLYEMDKYQTLKEKAAALYPLRIFMLHPNESELEHVQECLETTEKLADPDLYFLTVECSKKLFGLEIIEKITKEALYMSSALYKSPFEAGKEEGIAIGKKEGKAEGKEEGKAEGKAEGKIELVEKLLTKKFGILPDQIRKKIGAADNYRLNLIVENVFDLNSLAEVEKYLP